jgi:hypothetical protein
VEIITSGSNKPALVLNQIDNTISYHNKTSACAGVCICLTYDLFLRDSDPASSRAGVIPQYRGCSTIVRRFLFFGLFIDIPVQQHGWGSRSLCSQAVRLLICGRSARARKPARKPPGQPRERGQAFNATRPSLFVIEISWHISFFVALGASAAMPGKLAASSGRTLPGRYGLMKPNDLFVNAS